MDISAAPVTQPGREQPSAEPQSAASPAAPLAAKRPCSRGLRSLDSAGGLQSITAAALSSQNSGADAGNIVTPTPPGLNGKPWCLVLAVPLRCRLFQKDLGPAATLEPCNASAIKDVFKRLWSHSPRFPGADSMFLPHGAIPTQIGEPHSTVGRIVELCRVGSTDPTWMIQVLALHVPVGNRDLAQDVNTLYKGEFYLGLIRTDLPYVIFYGPCGKLSVAHCALPQFEPRRRSQTLRRH